MNSCKYDHHRQTDPGVNLHLARFVLVGLVLVKSEIEVLTFSELIIKSFQHARFMKLCEYTHILTSVDRVGSIKRRLSMNYVYERNPPCLRDKTKFIYTKYIGAAISFCLKCFFKHGKRSTSNSDYNSKYLQGVI